MNLSEFHPGLFTASKNGFYKYWLQPLHFTAFLDRALGNAPFGISTRGIAKTGPESLLIGTESNSVSGPEPHDAAANPAGRPFAAVEAAQ